MVIDNKPGAGGVIGTDIAAKFAPDGNTLVALRQHRRGARDAAAARGYVLMRDLTVVAPISTANNVLVVHPSVPADSLAEFVALLQREPGRWNYAHSGPGTPYHIAGEMLKSMAGVDMVGVAFRGSNEARTAVIGGQVPIMFDGIPTMAPQIEAGRVRALATTAPAARPGAARPARGGGTGPGLRLPGLDRPDDAGGDAAADRRAAACRDQPHHGLGVRPGGDAADGRATAGHEPSPNTTRICGGRSRAWRSSVRQGQSARRMRGDAWSSSA